MRKWEIDKKFDEIVDFAGVEAYIDTPVKRYSSGMYVRLAFAVAAFLEPEILIIDEVLAVGDAEFQKKCLGRMKDVSENYGRTVLFVSHNLAAVTSLCNSGLLIKNGTSVYSEDAMNAISLYLQKTSSSKEDYTFINDKNLYFGINQVSILNQGVSIQHSESIKIKVKLNGFITKCHIGISILNNLKIKLFTTVHFITEPINEIICEIPGGYLLQGNFSLDIATFKDKIVYEYITDICNFVVQDFENDYKIQNGKIGDINIKCIWEH
jgi:lipopolysaccharide transport system ATP-binding protein